jgi:hypothetical protein
LSYRYFANQSQQFMQQYMPALQTDICSDMGNELLSYAQRFEQNPQQLVGSSWLLPCNDWGNVAWREYAGHRVATPQM